MQRNAIKDFYGRVLGYIQIENDGRQKAFDYKGRLLGTYYPDRNTTNDFYGRVVYKGNAVASLIPARFEDID